MFSSKLLGERLKYYRKRKNLTQGELAQRLFVSEQVISKWENSRCNPDLENLCAIAEVLNVTTDALLGVVNEMGLKVFIAIDGGGTKTDFFLFAESGEVLARTRLSGTNPNVYGMEQTKLILKEGINFLMRPSVKVEGIYAGISGCAFGKNNTDVLNFLKLNYPRTKVKVDSDITNTIYSTPYYDKCIATIAGTGSVIYVKDKEKTKLIGGWGYLFDKSYNGFYLGSEVIRAVLAHEDGVGEQTLLTTLFYEIFGVKARETISEWHKKTTEEIASLSKILFTAYDRGDVVAKNILESAICLFTNLLNKTITASNLKTVIFSGGLIARKDVLERFLQKQEGVKYVFCDLPPIFGACRHCAMEFGNPKENFEQVFMRSYKENDEN